MQARWLLASSLLVSACAAEDDKGPAGWEPGKGDGAFELVEAGPATFGTTELVLDRAVPAYRVASYGGTRLHIELAGRGDADGHLLVEGPPARDGDGVRVGAGRLIAEDDDSGAGRAAVIDVTLDKPGVYRIIAGTFESLGAGELAPKGTLDFTVTCSAACARQGLDQKSFVRLMQQQAGGAFAQQAKAQLAAVIPDPAVAAALGAQLDQILADPDLAGLERFPTIPLAQIAAVRPALGGLQADPPAPDQVVRGELADLLGSCEATRDLPPPVKPQLPDIRSGHFPSTVLSPCQYAHAGKLGEVMTALAAGNGSSVSYQGETITTPGELIEALIASGHTVQVRNERMYANFLSLIVGDKDLIWPVWLDTGLDVGGESLTIPVGHSHHAWRISGPHVNTRVMFYLGVSGTGFFGQTDQRPAWSGTIASTDVTVARGGEELDYLISTVDTAAAYLRRNRVERATVAAGMPADGYGFLGVCNDSNAAIELETRGTISTFPLLRAAELDAAGDLGDGLDDTLRALPNDGDGIADRADALRRAVEMQPFADGELDWDGKLADQLAAARRRL